MMAPYGIAPTSSPIVTAVIKCFQLAILGFYYLSDEKSDEKDDDDSFLEENNRKTGKPGKTGKRFKVLFDYEEGFRKVLGKDQPTPKPVKPCNQKASNYTKSRYRINNKEINEWSEWEDCDSEYDLYDYSTESELEKEESRKELKLLYRK